MSTNCSQVEIGYLRRKNMEIVKEKSSKNINNDDSGYSSDSSASSYSSNKKHHNLNASRESLSQFLTPDVNWKDKIRFNSTGISNNTEASGNHDVQKQSSTPFTLNKSKIVKTPDLDPIEGPLLRSHTYPGTTVCAIKNFGSLLETSRHSSYSVSTKSTQTSPIEKIKLGKKASILLRSPLKSPFKLIKKQKSSEDVFSDPEIRQRTVKALFSSSKSDVTTDIPIKRFSPKFSNILTKIIDNANYILPNVLHFLNDKDIFNASQVCQKLRFVIQGSTALNTKKNCFIERRKKELEKLGKENVTAKLESSSSLSSISRPSPRKHLQELQSALPVPQEIPSLSPLSRFEKFVKEGMKLAPGEIQQKCVQCQNPAHISKSEHKAHCMDESCGFVYCTRCLLPFHLKITDCLALKPKPKISTATKILSKACKKRLRRL